MFTRQKCLFFLLFFFVLALLVPAKVYAGADFSQAPLSDIIAVARDPDGNIVAFDYRGSIAMFDYYRWNLLVSDNQQLGKAYVENNRVALGFRDNYGSFNVRIYNIQTKQYEKIVASSGNVCLPFLRNGELYRVDYTGGPSSYGKPLLYKWTDGSGWSLFAQGNDNSLYCPVGAVAYYEKSTDTVYVLFARNGLNDSVPWKYTFSNNTWTGVSYYFAGTLQGVVGKNGYFVVADYYYPNYRVKINSNNAFDTSSKPTRVFSTPEQDILGAGVDGKLYLAGDNVSFWQASNTMAFVASAMCYDKYGNLFIGENSGNVVVRDVNGGYHTDTAFYTDIVINYDIKPNVSSAANAAIQARDAANAANSNAWSAYNAANSAKASADSAAANTWRDGRSAAHWAEDAANNSWYGPEGKSVSQVAVEARDKAAQTLSAVNNLQTTVNNINNTITTQDSVPPSVELDTVSGAKATSSSSIQLIIAASDNKSSTFTYSVNGGSYSTLPADGKITVSLPSIGPNTITVRVKDEAGNTAVKTIKIWRLN